MPGLKPRKLPFPPSEVSRENGPRRCTNIGMWKHSSVIIGLLCSMLAFGQVSKQSAPDASNPDRAKPDRTQTMRVDVDLVLLNATVTDSANRFVTGLRQEDFKVWEDKIEQKIDYFSSENVPLSVGIIFDISGSMADKVRAAVTAATTFLRMTDPDDEYFLVQFSDAPEVTQDFTTDISKLQSQLLFAKAKGRTSLYDALYLGLEKIGHGRNARKALLVITDGEDNHSRYSLGNVREFAREHDVMIYSIGIINPMEEQYGGFSGRGVLDNLANLTGGEAFFPESIQALPGICSQIGLDLKTQYLLGYRSANATADGKWRKIRVKIN